jgi:altered-inheritance-of-mitochondria protein 13
LQTDASRAKLIEQHVQSRVAEELRKLQQKESEALNVAHEKVASSEDSNDNKITSFSLGKEVEQMQRRLEERRKVRELPENVENARGAVIRCLRENDRRPLDCWLEVEAFKTEVKKLEKTWVDKITS